MSILGEEILTNCPQLIEAIEQSEVVNGAEVGDTEGLFEVAADGCLQLLKAILMGKAKNFMNSFLLQWKKKHKKIICDYKLLLQIFEVATDGCLQLLKAILMGKAKNFVNSFLLQWKKAIKKLYVITNYYYKSLR